jgi:N-glycosidase YbiA
MNKHYHHMERGELRFLATHSNLLGHTYSNFSEHPFYGVYANDRTTLYRTNEHYFQSKKFEGSSEETTRRIIKAETPFEAVRISIEAERDGLVRRDWESVKECVMWEGLLLKAVYNKAFVFDLLASGERKLIYASRSDYYWGEGHHRTGDNRLGGLLMKLRSVIREDKMFRVYVKRCEQPPRCKKNNIVVMTTFTAITTTKKCT